MRLSIIIPTHNRLEILKQALVCIEAQTTPAGLFEVIVVDDASGDGTAAFLAQYSPPFTFRYFCQSMNGGPAKARNTGILAAKGELVLILNDDTLLAPDALAVHIGVHNALEGQAVSVLGRFDLPEDFSETLWGYMLQNSDLLFRYPALEHNHVYGHECYWSCNISTPRSALLEAGLFDEAFSGGAWGAEDQELGRRLMDLNIPVLYREDCHAVHMHRLTVDGFVKMSLARGGGGVLLFAKHNISCHYHPGITEVDVAFWRNIPTRLQTAVEGWHALLRQTETLVLRCNESRPPYLYRVDYPEVLELAHSLFRLRTRDLLAVVSSCSEQLQSLLEHAKPGTLSMEDAAKLLYSLCLILRFYHDSVGICATDTIYRFTGLSGTAKSAGQGDLYAPAQPAEKV